MRVWIRAAIAALILLLLLAGTAALFGPNLLRQLAQDWVREETGRTLELGKVNVNLLALSVEIHDVTLTETAQATPFVRWKRLYVALSPRSLWHWAPVIRELQLDQPVMRIERQTEGRFNFSDLFDREEGDGPAPDQTRDSVHFSLNNLVIHDGKIDFIDQALAKPVVHRVEALELAVPFFGNLPYLADRYVAPLLNATVNGTPFELKGELKPFADTQEYLLKLKFDGIDLPRYLSYLPAKLPLKVESGLLDIDLDLTCRVSAAAKPQLDLAGRFDLSVLDLREPDGRPLLFVPLLEGRLAPSQPLDLQFHLAALFINNPQGWVDRNPAGEWNIMRLAGVGQADAAPASGTPAEPSPLQLRIDQLKLQKGRLELRDALPAGRFDTILGNINLVADGFTLAQGTPFKLAMNLATGRQERLGISGQVIARPFTLDLAIEAAGVPMAAYQPYYHTEVAAAINGELDVSSRLRVKPGQPLLLSELRLALRNLDLPLPGDEGFSLASAVVEGGSFNLAANRLEITDLALNDADLRFSRNKGGHWSFLDRNYPLLAKLAAPSATPVQPDSERPAFSYRIGRVALGNARISFRDELPAEPAHLSIHNLGMTVHELAAPEQVPAGFDIHGVLAQRGALQASGVFNPTGPEINATIRLQHVALKDFAPYVQERYRLVLVDGTLDAKLVAAAVKQKAGWRGRFSGDLGVSRFYCLDAAHREDLLRWDRLQVSGLDARLEPLSLQVAAVAIDNYYARVLLDEQARLNLADVFVRSAAPDKTGKSAAKQVALAPGQSASPAPEIRIGKITLQDGTVNFTDRHMPRTFSVEMLQLGGRIEGLSSRPGARAEVDLRGRLRNESPLTVAGTFNPLAEPLFLDLKLDFKNIELSPLSPYSGTYIGYLIDKGKLNVALRYLVENGKLDSSNQIFLDQLTFGDAVESDRATSLPVRLAVALLKDRRGEIHLDIPVSGNLDDPQFSVWRIIWQIIRNLLVKAVTSPFALLGALAGTGEDFNSIAFPPGSATLTAAEQSKLTKIADALRERSELKIEVKGYIDPQLDPEGYRLELLQEKIRREKQIELRKQLGDAAPAEAAAVTVAPEEYSEYLWRVYKAADFPKPRNFFFMTKHLPDAEMEKLLLANTRVGTDELTRLAQARASSVVKALVETGGISRERIFLVTGDVTAPPATEGATRSRVEFGLAVK